MRYRKSISLLLLGSLVVLSSGCDLFRKRMECAIAVAVARETEALE